MSLSIVYCDPDLSTGDNDGSSEANAWQTLAKMATDISAGDHCYLQKTSSAHNPGGTTDFAISSTLTAPILIEAYETTPGDGGVFECTRKISFAGDFITVIGVKVVTSTAESAVWGYGSDLLGLYKCYGSQSGTSTARGLGTLNSCVIAGCYGGGVGIGIEAKAACVVGCYASAACEGLKSSFSSAAQTLVFNAVQCDGSHSGISLPNVNACVGLIVAYNSVYDGAPGIEISQATDSGDLQGTIISKNVVYSDNDYGIENTDTPTSTMPGLWGNAVYGSSDDYTGFGDFPVTDGELVEITGDPFTDAVNDDFTLDSTAAQGLVCREAAWPDTDLDGTDDNYVSLGAIQLEAATGATTGQPMSLRHRGALTGRRGGW